MSLQRRGCHNHVVPQSRTKIMTEERPGASGRGRVVAGLVLAVLLLVSGLVEA